MGNENLWNRFEASGSISDYLAYVRAKEENDADQDERYDPETA